MPEKGLRRWIVTLTVITASLLELIDTTIVNVSLPNIMGNLGATLDSVGWVVTSYAVANVIILPMSGWLGQRLGRKNYFLLSIIFFTLASFFCGHAGSLNELIMFRIIQGLAGGGLLSTAQAILIEAWPSEQIGFATALFGMGAVVGPTVGPTIGGFITDHFSWPWIFYVNIPVGALAAFFVFTFIRRTPRTPRQQPIDWWGILLLALSVGCLQTVLEKGQRDDWFNSVFISVLAFLALAGGVGFLWRELVTEYPVVDFRIMRHRRFSVGMFTSFILGLGLYGSVFVFPVLCQNILGFTAEQTGLILFPGGLATIFMMPFVGLILRRNFPAQFLAAAGMFVFYLFCLKMVHLTTGVTGTQDFFWPLIIRGVGMSLLFVPITTLAVQDLRGKEIGQGAGLNNMARQLGGSFGIALITTFLARRIAYHRVMLLGNMNLYSDPMKARYALYRRGFLSRGFDPHQASSMAYKVLDLVLTKQSALLAYADVFWLVGVFFLFVIPMLVFPKIRKGNVAMPAPVH